MTYLSTICVVGQIGVLFAQAREHEGTERETEGVGCDMSYSLKLFLVSGSLFSETSAWITTSI